MLIKPKKLKRGDTVCLIAPCNSLSEAGGESVKAAYEAQGFKVKFGRNAFKMTDGYAASARERADDFNAAVLDEEVSMIMFSGGEIGNEILPYVDFDAIARNPKIICSYSDGTSIVEPVHSKTGLVTYYGSATRVFDNGVEYNRRWFEKRFMSDDCSYDKSGKWRTVCPGVAEGVICAGYLINFDTLINSPYFDLPDENYILVIEDHEKFSSPKVVSKWLSDLIQKGVFDRATGLIFGHYSSDPEKVDKLCAVLDRLVSPLGIPVVYCDDFGHGEYVSAFPIGVNAKLDTCSDLFELSSNGTV